MTTTDGHPKQNLGRESLDLAFRSLEIRLQENNAKPIEIVVCGGSALIFTEMVTRTTTKDVDVVAILQNGRPCAPTPMPESLLLATREVAEDLGLDSNWLNNGPSSAEGGLFQMGLPKGFSERLSRVSFGEKLKVHFAGRIDQIHFKLYAAVDSGGYHINDLRELSPTDDELAAAAEWCITHDVSAAFKMLLRKLLQELNHENAAERI